MTAPKQQPAPTVSRRELNEELVMLRAKTREQEAEIMVMRRGLGSVFALLDPHRALWGDKMLELLRYMQSVSKK